MANKDNQCNCLKCKITRANKNKESGLFLTKEQHKEYHMVKERSYNGWRNQR